MSESWEWPIWGDDGKRNSIWAKNQIERCDIEFKESGFNILIGPMFLCKRNFLDKVKKLKFNKILPTNKSEMEMMERLWGLLIDEIGYTDMVMDNVILKNRSGSTGKDILKLKNYKTDSIIKLKVKISDLNSGDKLIKYWSGRL